MTLSNVVLPQPEGPISETKEPAGTSSERPASTVCAVGPAKATVTSRTAMSGRRSAATGAFVARTGPARRSAGRRPGGDVVLDRQRAQRPGGGDAADIHEADDLVFVRHAEP